MSRQILYPILPVYRYLLADHYSSVHYDMRVLGFNSSVRELLKYSIDTANTLTICYPIIAVNHGISAG